MKVIFNYFKVLQMQYFFQNNKFNHHLNSHRQTVSENGPTYTRMDVFFL